MSKLAHSLACKEMWCLYVFLMFFLLATSAIKACQPICVLQRFDSVSFCLFFTDALSYSWGFKSRDVRFKFWCPRNQKKVLKCFLLSRIPLVWQVHFYWNCRFLLCFSPLYHRGFMTSLEEQSDQQTFLFPFVSARHKNSCQAGYLQLSL